MASFWHHTQRFFSTALSALGRSLGIVLLGASTALAWNGPGHQAIDLIAYAQLRPAQRAAAVALLREHPRFEPHFSGVMPQEVWQGSPAEQDQWVFAHAGTWPDQVRSASASVTQDDVRQYNRPTWHYVNVPVFLTAAEEDFLAPGLRIHRDPEPGEDRDDPHYNILQAFKNSCRIVADREAPPAHRAVHLCWLLHLGGDAHQPLHASALFTSQRFPAGDKRGNEIQVRGSLKLHAMWDRALVDSRRYNDVRGFAVELATAPARRRLGEAAASQLAIDDWIAESHAIAAKDAYSPHVRAAVAAAESLPKLGAINPPAADARRASEVSRRRGVEAGFRLAALLNELLVDSPAKTPHSP